MNEERRAVVSVMAWIAVIKASFVLSAILRIMMEPVHSRSYLAISWPPYTYNLVRIQIYRDFQKIFEDSQIRAGRDSDYWLRYGQETYF